MVNLQAIIPRIPEQALAQLVEDQQNAETQTLGNLIGTKGLLGSVQVSPENQPVLDEYTNKWNATAQGYIQDLMKNPQNAIKASKELALIGMAIQNEVKTGAISKMANAFKRHQDSYEEAKKSGKYDPAILSAIYGSDAIKQQFIALNSNPNAPVNVTPLLYERPDYMKKITTIMDKVRTEYKDEYISEDRVRRIAEDALANDPDVIGYNNMINTYLPNNLVMTKDGKYISKSNPSVVTDKKEDGMTIGDYDRYSSVDLAVKMYGGENNPYEYDFESDYGYRDRGSTRGRKNSDINGPLTKSETLLNPEKPDNIWQNINNIDKENRELNASILEARKYGDIGAEKRLQDRLNQNNIDRKNLAARDNSITQEVLDSMTRERRSLITNDKGRLLNNKELNEKHGNFDYSNTSSNTFPNISMTPNLTLGKQEEVSSAYAEFRKRYAKVQASREETQTRVGIRPNKELNDALLTGPLFSTSGLKEVNVKGQIQDVTLDAKTTKVLEMSHNKENGFDILVQDKNGKHSIRLDKSRSDSIARMMYNPKFGKESMDMAIDVKKGRGEILSRYIDKLYGPGKKSKEYYGNTVTIPINNAKFDIVKSKNGSYIIKNAKVGYETIKINYEIPSDKNNDKRALADFLLEYGNIPPQEMISKLRELSSKK